MAFGPSGRGTAAAASVLACVALAPVPAAGEPFDLDIKRLTLEQLMDLDVYSVSRKIEPVRGAPAAVYVLTGEDIRRARVNSIPDALRLVPGVQVARIDANKWAVSIRGFVYGFNTRTVNKLLVLIDGRSVYDPLFSGVFWETTDVMLEDVERIEVIRGPGGTLWGANAVNGVINIITRHARDTQGGIATAGAGTEERAFGAVRHGWRAGKNGYARVYAKYNERDPGFSPAGPAVDEFDMGRAGFRWDWDATPRDAVRVSGDMFDAEAGERSSPAGAQDVRHRGGNVLMNWRRTLARDGHLRVQFYYDRLDLDNVNLSDERDTYDLEFQHGFRAGPAHAIVWGAGHRQVRDDVENGPVLALDPTVRTLQVSNAFVQDELHLVPDRLRLMLGVKVERNDYTGTEWQPGMRLAYTPNDRETWWAAISRAVRTPSRLEADLVFGGSRLGDGFDAEKLTAYEAGYRVQPSLAWSWDLALFYHDYDDLFTIEQGFQFDNRMAGNTRGLEISARWDPLPRARLEAAYTFLDSGFALKPGSIDAARPSAVEGNNPQHQLALRAGFEPHRDLDVDVIVRRVDDLPAIAVPAYTALDLGLSWHGWRDVELTLVGRDLLDSHHPEQRSGIATEVQRGVYGKVTWRF